MKLTILMLVTLTCSTADPNPQALDPYVPTQFHIQEDTGDNRWFKYQTLNGSFRKEVRRPDGSFVGAYGWVDPNGILRVYEYIADDRGYRITKSEKIDVNKQQNGGGVPVQPAVPALTTAPAAAVAPAVPAAVAPAVPVAAVAPAAPAAPAESSHLLPTLAGAEVGNAIYVPVIEPIFASPARIQPLTAFFQRPAVQARQLPVQNSQQFGYSEFYNPDDIYIAGRNPKLFRKRKLASLPEPRPATLAVKQRRKTVDYQTSKQYHREQIADDGSRTGEYGYIDPIGVKRVVSYTTGSRGSGFGIRKTKDNKYVGPNAFFTSSA